MLAEDGQGFVEASGGPERLDGLVEDQAKASGLTAGPLKELSGSVGPETSVVRSAPASDGLGDHPASGESPGLGSQRQPPESGGLLGPRVDR
jgi:hypothetical protein